MTTYAQADRTLEFRTSPLKMYGFAAALVALTIAFLFMIVSGSGPEKALGAAGFVLFGIASVAVFRRGFRNSGQPTLILSPEGFRDIRIADTWVPWAAVREVVKRPINRHDHTIIVTPYDTPVPGFDRANFGGRLEALIGTGQIAIDVSELEGDSDYILEMFRVYLGAHGRPFGRR